MPSKRTLAFAEMDTRSRTVVSAMRCFARSGFAGTSLADIETEAGLSVGAGGTYRYFASKQAMLEAAVSDALIGADELSAAQPQSLADAGRMALDSMDSIRDLTRIVLRDLDQFPELLTPVLDRLLEGPIRTVATSMSRAAPGLDSDAMATLLIGALVNVRVIEAIGGSRPAMVDDERLVAAWSHLYQLALDNPS